MRDYPPGSLIPRLHIPALSVHESQHAAKYRLPDERNLRRQRAELPALHLMGRSMRHLPDDVTDGALMSNASEAEAALFQADVALLAENDVVEQLDLQRLASAA